MSSTNQSPEFSKAQGKFLKAETNEERLEALEEMIQECPKHKGAENMLSNLKTRYKKLKEKLEKTQKFKKSHSRKKGIRKEEMQAVIIGKSNSGKSSLLNRLTNASPIISQNKFTTVCPEIGMMEYQNMNIQLIENCATNSEYFDKGIANTADTLLIMINSLKEIEEINPLLSKAKGKRIIIFNKSDMLNFSEKRKISATLQSKKHNFIMISNINEESSEELKEKIFSSFDKIRVFAKEPEKKEKSQKPIIMKPNSTIKDIAEKILKGFSKNIKETKIWGPSSKFSGQKVGLKHKVKDLDTVEFKTK